MTNPGPSCALVVPTRQKPGSVLERTGCRARSLVGTMAAHGDWDESTSDGIRTPEGSSSTAFHEPVRPTARCLSTPPPSPVGSANNVAVTSPDVTRCHGMSQGDRERSQECRKNVARCRKNVEMSWRVAQDR